jgi:Fe2+ transport system protein FeoA
MRLDELGQGETAEITEVFGNDVLASRLMEMGIIDGEPITMIGKAPMGDPIEFSVQGYRISLRKTEAARVQIARTK